jgi:hypothetical protein
MIKICDKQKEIYTWKPEWGPKEILFIKMMFKHYISIDNITFVLSLDF